MLGCTVSMVGGIKKGIDRAAALGYQCTQIYTTRSRTWDIGNAVDENIRSYACEKNVYLVAHIPLIVNIASASEEIREKSERRIYQEVERARLYGINTLVLHPGSTIDGDVHRGIAQVIQILDGLYEPCMKCGISLALETMSGQGTQIGSQFEELAQIIDGVKKNEHLSICFDTCHVYAAGYPIGEECSLQKIFKKFDLIVGLKRIKVFHLNNTKTKCGQKTDRHTSIFDGEIKLETFESIVKDERYYDIPKIIEPSAKDSTGSEQVQYLSRVLKGYPDGN